MMIQRRCQDPVSHTPGSRDVANRLRGLVPAEQFDEMLGRAFAAAVAAPEWTPRPSRTSRSVAVFYVDVDRFDLAAAGLTDSAMECALTEVGRRLASWAGRAGAVTRRGDDHFILLCHPGSRTSVAAEVDDRSEDRCAFDGDACERALADLRHHFHRPMLIAGRRLCVSGHVDVIDVGRASGTRCEPLLTESN